MNDPIAHLRRERELHERFAATRLHGEWFTLAEELRAVIAEVS